MTTLCFKASLILRTTEVLPLQVALWTQRSEYVNTGAGTFTTETIAITSPVQEASREVHDATTNSIVHVSRATYSQRIMITIDSSRIPRACLPTDPNHKALLSLADHTSRIHDTYRPCMRINKHRMYCIINSHFLAC